MTKTHSTRLSCASAVILALAVTSSGCKSSGGGSRWAWNPWSKSGADEAAALAESSAKLPSDDATPQIEGSTTTPETALAAVSVPAKTPPSMAGLVPAIEAVASATPKIEKPAPTAPNWEPYQNAPSTTAPSAPPSTTVAATSTPAASGGPYDPNGYKPAAATPAATTDRYGIGNRYAASTPDGGEDANPFGDLPAVASLPASNSSLGDRYGAAPAANAVADVAKKAQAAAEATTDRYAAAAEQAATTTKIAYADTANQASTALSQASPYPTASAYPTTPAASPAYPSTGSVASTPAASPYPVTSPAATPPGSSATVGVLPPSGSSVYAATQPVTPVEPASASSPTDEPQGSVIRLTSLPGEYRPGGTSTYQSSVNVATRPEGASSSSSAPATTSRY